MKICFVYLFTLLFCSVAAGQSNGKEKGVQFTCMLWSGEAIEVFYRDGDKPKPIRITPGRRSYPHQLEKSTDFLLVKENPDAKTDEGESPYIVLAKSPIMPTKKMLFILIDNDSTTEDQLPYRVIALDDSTSNFPAGSFMFYNMNQEDVFVDFGGGIKVVKGNKTTKYKTSVSSDGGLIPFQIRNKEGQKIFETRLFGQPKGREIVFIGPPKKEGGLPSLRFLSQIVAQEKPSE